LIGLNNQISLGKKLWINYSISIFLAIGKSRNKVSAIHISEYSRPLFLDCQICAYSLEISYSIRLTRFSLSVPELPSLSCDHKYLKTYSQIMLKIPNKDSFISGKANYSRFRSDINLSKTVIAAIRKIGQILISFFSANREKTNFAGLWISEDSLVSTNPIRLSNQQRHYKLSFNSCQDFFSTFRKNLLASRRSDSNN
jgi:hypothetical protein